MESELIQRFREVSQQVQSMRVAIRATLLQPAGSSSAQTGLRQLATQAPEVFFEGAMSLLETSAGSSDAANIHARLLGCPEFLIELTRPHRFSHAKLLALCLGFIKVVERLDIFLADLLPHRFEDKYQLPHTLVARILDILNEISTGPRLVLLLGHLANHPDPVVAERAVVLMGRRICNAAWSQRYLMAADEGVRAGAVESLWGRDTTAARTAMWGFVKDPSHRVVGNALLGLHLLGERSVDELATNMLDDARPPFRSTAAKVLGQIGKQEYTSHLVKAAADCDPTVRLEAKRALVTIRLPILRQQEAAAEALPPAPTICHETIVETCAETLDNAPDPPYYQIRLDGKHTSTR
ncbi:MAG: HEAT repeat domain-containing protein [Bryobacteraceae bacterium]